MKPSDPTVEAALPNPSSAQGESRLARFEPLLLAAIVALALAFRLREAARTPFWFDELFTLWIARHPLPQMMTMIAGNIHPPLPTLLVALWRAIGGENPLWLKTQPMLLGLLTVAATFGFAKALFGRNVALLAAGLLALHPAHIYFSQELRSYAQLTLALLLSAWTAWRWLETGRGRDALFWILAASFTLYTHYLGVLVLALLDLLVLAMLWRTPRRMAAWILIHLGVAALAIPLAWILPAQLRLSQYSWLTPPSLADLVNLARRTAFGAVYMLPVLGLVALLPLLRPAQRRAALLAWWMGVVPVLFTFILTRHGGHYFAERYMFFTLPYWCVLFAAGLVGLRWRGVAAAASIGLLLFAGRAAVLKRPMAEAVVLRQAARMIGARLQPGDLLFCADTHSLLCLDYHLREQRAVLVRTRQSLPYFVGSAIVPDSRRVPPDSVGGAARAGRRWWGVRTREGGFSTLATGVLMDSLARGGRRQIVMTTVWAGRPGMLADDR